jgi:hypothetical protein
MRCIVWPEQFLTFGELVRADAVLGVLGVIDKRLGSEEANLIVNELLRLEELSARYTRSVMLRVFEDQHGQRGLEQLYEILRGYPGTCAVQLVICLADGVRVPCRCDSLKVEINSEMRSRVEALIGPANFALQAAPHTAGAPRDGNWRSRNSARAVG